MAFQDWLQRGLLGRRQGWDFSHSWQRIFESYSCSQRGRRVRQIPPSSLICIKDRHVPLVWHMERKGWMAGAWLLPILCLSRAPSTKGPRWGSSTSPVCWGLLRGVLILGQNEPTVLELFGADLKMQRFSQTEQTETLTVSRSSHYIWRCSFCFLLWGFVQRQWLSGCQRPGVGKFPVSNVAGLKWGTACEINAIITRSLELVPTHHRKQRNPAVQYADCSQGCSAPSPLTSWSSVIQSIWLNELQWNNSLKNPGLLLRASSLTGVEVNCSCPNPS